MTSSSRSSGGIAASAAPPVTHATPRGVGTSAAVAPILVVDGLTVGYPMAKGHALAVNEVSFSVLAGERVGIVGESGSGKSTLALALMRLLPSNAVTLAGAVSLAGRDLLAMSEVELRAVRGVQAGMVFQNPMTSFDPLRTLGDHLAEGLRAHGATSRGAIRERAVAALGEAEMPQPRDQARRHPHELSGGMRQRGLIALAIENHPRLLIADEPTTALDVTIQAQILELFGRISAGDPNRGMGLLLVSHNLGVVRQLCTRVMVMYAGRIVEDAPADELFAEPRHPYTRALLEVTPRVDSPRGRLRTVAGQPLDITQMPAGCAFAARCPVKVPRSEAEVPPLVEIGDRRRVACFVGQSGPLPPSPEPEPELQAEASVPPHADAAILPPAAPTSRMLEVRDLVVDFSVRRATGILHRREALRAVAGVNLDLQSGETLAVVGESGSGKTTLARTVLGLQRPSSGSVRVLGDDPSETSTPVRRLQRIQAVFQDPHGSLDPRMTIGDSIEEPMRNMRIRAQDRGQRVDELLTEVRLPLAFRRRYPVELSGGQAQRIAIARALAVQPALIVLDEPTASLDVSIQGHIINLLLELQERHGLTYLFVTHDLVLVRQLATRIAVMYLGRVVELGDWDELYARPLHPYAAALLSGIPRVDLERGTNRRIILHGEQPSPLRPPPGCVFHPRCWLYERLGEPESCRSTPPRTRLVQRQLVECHFAEASQGDPPNQ
jgi:peptide/nickel transport system ATP-binding protein